MEEKPSDIPKKYFSISEVARMLDVNPSLIRFWESEFELLKPQKNKKGDRRFTQKDIADLKLIYQLVKVKGFTLEGAKEHIRQHAQDTRERIRLRDSLIKLKKVLEAIRDQIDD